MKSLEVLSFKFLRAYPAPCIYAGGELRGVCLMGPAFERVVCPTKTHRYIRTSVRLLLTEKILCYTYLYVLQVHYNILPSNTEYTSRFIHVQASKGMVGKVYLYPGNFLRSYLTYLKLR